MNPQALLSFGMAIATKILDMLLEGRDPKDIGETVALESAAFLAAQKAADAKSKAKFGDYRP